MKTSVIASASLVLGAALALSATGCKRTHYHVTTAAAVDPGADLRCAATCDRLVAERAIPQSAAKECQSACLSPAPKSPAPRPCEEARSHRRRRPTAPAAPPPRPACDDDADCAEDAVSEADSLD